MESFFREDRCTRCGECLTRCRYMELSRDQARREIDNLIAGRPSVALDQCVSCMSCDAFCPEDAHPYALFLERWSRRYRERGLPARASYLLPYHEPNYRQDLERHLTAREREMLAEWKNRRPEGEVLYPGCNLMTAPWLYDLSVFRDLPAAGDWSLCCGEPLYRMGLFDVMEKIARGLTAYYEDKPIERMVFVCPACLNMFSNVLPEKFGARFDFEKVYLGDWLLARMDAGEIEIKHPISGEVTVHDSCHGRVMGGGIMDKSRELIRRLGLSVVEMKSHHEEGICCGIAAGCNRYLPQDIVKVSVRELREGAGAGVDEMAIYCTGCYLMLNLTRHVWPGGQRLVHVLELLARALGEEKPSPVGGRTGKMLANVIVKAIPSMLSPARYKKDEVKVKKP